MQPKNLKFFLDQKAIVYEQTEFIENDPISIPHLFKKKEDIEISGFLIATISWGNRVSIIKSGKHMMDLMGYDPYHFVVSYSEKDIKKISSFIHRTFNGIDFEYFIRSLRNIYQNHGGLEKAFSYYPNAKRMDENIHYFRKIFFELYHEKRTIKHVSDPLNGSAAKRLNMYLRWMVRPSRNKVDFGLWNRIKPKQLSCPLDIHSGNVARKLGILRRNQNDQKALKELDEVLRGFDPKDPAKYDFALFGLGVYEKFNANDFKLKL